MHRMVIVFAIIAAAATAVSARNAADLIADLNGIKPAGTTEVKCVYIKSTDGFQEFAMFCSHTVVWGVSSTDGTPRRIYPASGSGAFFNVSLTADGRRVIIWDNSRDQMVVVNWDGSGARNVTVGGTMTEYWRAPDGKDWAVINKQSSQVDRVNIDTPSDVVHINMTVGSQSAPVSMSDDGKFLLIQGYSDFGLWDITGNRYLAGPNGCQPSLRPGTTHQWNLNPSGHHSMQLINQNGSVDRLIQTAQAANTYLSGKGLTATCESGDGLTQEGTRFAQHPDYVTFFVSQSKANPILCRFTDLKVAYIEDGLACNFVGDMDVVFLGSSVAARQVQHAPASITGAAASPGAMYGIDGRRVSPNRLSGIGLLSTSDGSLASKVLAVR